ncbi:MAG: transposase [Candidatus Vogelbacteria bacterium]|nr:transposase [Candidatus Vogelbacteria bacterium]
MRNLDFVEGEYYHIYNRGTDKRSIVEDAYDSNRFVQCLKELNVKDPIGSMFENSFRNKDTSSEPLVDIVCYCLNPNHYHLLLSPHVENGIEKFMHRLGTAHTKYYNNRHKRNGVLFQGKFKAVYVADNDYLLHVSSYVNINDRVHQLGSSASKLVRSSWDEYVLNKTGFCVKDVVLGQFKNPNEYKKFAEDSLSSMLDSKKEQRELDNFEFDV